MLEKQSLDEFLSNINKGRAVIVSLSPQSRASLAVHFGLFPLQVSYIALLFSLLLLLGHFSSIFYEMCLMIKSFLNKRWGLDLAIVVSVDSLLILQKLF